MSFVKRSQAVTFLLLIYAEHQRFVPTRSAENNTEQPPTERFCMFNRDTTLSNMLCCGIYSLIYCAVIDKTSTPLGIAIF